jgi:putative oxidoreductase
MSCDDCIGFTRGDNMAQRSSHPALSCTDGYAATWTDFLLLAGRVLLGWIFLATGWSKLGNIAGTAAYFANLGMSPPELMAWIAGFVELGLGAALILGLAARYAAIGTFLWVLIATVIAHRYWTYPPAQQGGQYNNFLKNLAIMGGALYVFVLGAGRYAVDAVLAIR